MNITKSSDDYISNMSWLRDIVGGKDLILRGVSALEYMGLFVGYWGENTIEVYAKEKGIYDNIAYHIVDTFDDIDFEKHGSVLCASFNQTVNDMLEDFDNCDEMALTEAISNYYYSNHENFDGIKVENKNLENFEIVKSNAMEYYSGG